MGLDMYIMKSKKGEEVAYWRKANAIHAFFERECAGEQSLENCQEVYISKETLEKLLKNCTIVLNILEKAKPLTVKKECGLSFTNGVPTTEFSDVAVYDDGTVARVCELLPPQEGFFFGSTDIDELYVSDIKETKEVCEKLLKETDFKTETLRYHAWW